MAGDVVVGVVVLVFVVTVLVVWVLVGVVVVGVGMVGVVVVGVVVVGVDADTTRSSGMLSSMYSTSASANLHFPPDVGSPAKAARAFNVFTLHFMTLSRVGGIRRYRTSFGVSMHEHVNLYYSHSKILPPCCASDHASLHHNDRDERRCPLRRGPRR